MSIQDTLKLRNLTHGDFATNAHIAQGLKTFFVNQPGYASLSEIQRESLDLIATKMSRILSGGFNNPDNWHDIAGYATLAEQEVTPPAEDKPMKKAIDDLFSGVVNVASADARPN